jgi:hypothetical protein
MYIRLRGGRRHGGGRQDYRHAAVSGGADPATLAGSHEFAKRRDQLQKKMAGVMSKSRTRFDDPWGLVSLFWRRGPAHRPE